MNRHPLESFTTRSAGLDDADALAALVNVCSLERTGRPQTTAQSLRAVMQTPGVNLETDYVLALDPNQRLVGYAVVRDTAPHTVLFALVDVHPHSRGLGIGSSLGRWAEERARRSVPRAPAGERVVLLQERLSTDAAAREFLLGRGYRVVRHNVRMIIELEAPPPQPALPPGVTIRPFNRAREGHALVRAFQEAFRGSWGYVERPIEEEHRRWMHRLDRDPDHDPSPFWFVARDGTEIAGLCLSDSREAGDSETGWIHIVGVRPAWRRQGLGLALLQHSFGALYHQGRQRIGLEVDTQNPTGATHLYEKAGMHVERQYDFFEKELRPGPEPAST
jgi:mycothiol synthase